MRKRIPWLRTENQTSEFQTTECWKLTNITKPMTGNISTRYVKQVHCLPCPFCFTIHDHLLFATRRCIFMVSGIVSICNSRSQAMKHSWLVPSGSGISLLLEWSQGPCTCSFIQAKCVVRKPFIVNVRGPLCRVADQRSRSLWNVWMQATTELTSKNASAIT